MPRENSQIWVVTHSEMLAAQIARYAGTMPRVVTKENGVTTIRRAAKERPVHLVEAAE